MRNDTFGIEQRVKLGFNAALRNDLAVTELSIQSCLGWSESA